MADFKKLESRLDGCLASCGTRLSHLKAAQWILAVRRRQTRLKLAMFGLPATRKLNVNPYSGRLGVAIQLAEPQKAWVIAAVSRQLEHKTATINHHPSFHVQNFTFSRCMITARLPLSHQSQVFFRLITGPSRLYYLLHSAFRSWLAKLQGRHSCHHLLGADSVV